MRMEPPRRWICVVVGVFIPDDGGEFSADAISSGIGGSCGGGGAGGAGGAARRPAAGAELFACALVVPFTGVSVLRVGLVYLRFFVVGWGPWGR